MQLFSNIFEPRLVKYMDVEPTEICGLTLFLTHCMKPALC
jgi:hypothetical protein